MQTWEIVWNKVLLVGAGSQYPGLLAQALTPRHHTEKLDLNPQIELWDVL